MGRWTVCVAACWTLALAGCQGGSLGFGGDPIAQAREDIEAGRLDAALKRLEGVSPSAEALYLQGVVWSRKGPRGEGAQLGDGERRAVDLFEQALKIDGSYGWAHLGIADLLAPHALAQVSESAEAAAAAPAAPGTGTPKPPAPDMAAAPTEGGEDGGPAEDLVGRVVSAYEQASHTQVGRAEALEALADFARKAGRLDAADGAFKALVALRPEDKRLPARYGDFLRDDMKDRERALQQYDVALVWSPDDVELQGKMATIYLDMAEEHLAAREYPWADKNLTEARKHVASSSSPLGQRLRELQAQLDRIRPHR